MNDPFCWPVPRARQCPPDTGAAIPSRRRSRAWTFAALVTASCLASPSDEDIKQQFAAYVASANSCQQASECAIASAECPLGCFVAVRADRKADVERKARELVAAYERGGASCQYDCVAPGQPACVHSR